MRGSFRIIIALIVAGFSFLTYWCRQEANPVTGEMQHVNMTAEEEVALGLQAAPQMAQQYGGIHPDQKAGAAVSAIGQKLVQASGAGNSPYRFDFHLLADEQTINAFALPGGQVFITAGLLKHLKSEGQVAGVLAHEIGHVIGRHSAEQLAKNQLTQGLAGAAGIAAYDPDRPGRSVVNAAVAAAIAKVVSLRFGRNDELEADRLAVKYTGAAGYDPRAMIQVMQILQEQGGGGRGPEFMSTHPDPGNRIGVLEEEIQKDYPNGVPGGLNQ
jgi:predicted Zn-dependent protease